MYRTCLFLDAAQDPFRLTADGAREALQAAVPNALLYTQTRALGEQIEVDAPPAHAGVAEVTFDDAEEAIWLARHPDVLAPLWQGNTVSVAAAIVGRDHVIMRSAAHYDQPSIKGVFPFRRRSDVAVADFQRHWLHTHGPIAARTEGATCYVQCHAPLSWYDPAPPYDGLTEIYWPDAAAARLAMSSRQMREDQAGDARNFADPDGVVLFLAQEERVLDW